MDVIDELAAYREVREMMQDVLVRFNFQPPGLLDPVYEKLREIDPEDWPEPCGVFVPAIPGLSTGYYCRYPKPCWMHDANEPA